MDLNITHIGTATMLLEVGALRLLTDPVFDQAERASDWAGADRPARRGAAQPRQRGQKNG